MTSLASHEALLDQLFMALVAKVRDRLQKQAAQLPTLALPSDSGAAAEEAGRLIESVYYQSEKLENHPLTEWRKAHSGPKELVIDLVEQLRNEAKLNDQEALMLLKQYAAAIPKQGAQNYAVKLQQLRETRKA